MRFMASSIRKKKAIASTSLISIRLRAPWFISAADFEVEILIYDVAAFFLEHWAMAEDESKYFSLTESERLRVQLEPILIEAMESRRKMSDVDEQISRLAEKI